MKNKALSLDISQSWKEKNKEDNLTEHIPKAVKALSQMTMHQHSVIMFCCCIWNSHALHLRRLRYDWLLCELFIYISMRAKALACLAIILISEPSSAILCRIFNYARTKTDKGRDKTINAGSNFIEGVCALYEWERLGDFFSGQYTRIKRISLKKTKTL